MAKDTNLASGSRDEPEHNFQSGAFTAAIRTKQTIDLATGDLEREIIDCPELETTDTNAEILG